MAQWYIVNGKMRIGAIELPRHKKPVLCVEENGNTRVFATFKNSILAEAFMRKLVDFLNYNGGAEDA